MVILISQDSPSCDFLQKSVHQPPRSGLALTEGRCAIKKCLRHFSSPYPLIHEGVAFCATFLHTDHMNILQEIFADHYEEMIYTLHPRDAVVENVEKMIHCGDPSYGGAMYGCPKCGKLKFVPFRCHSRFCPTCGNKYSMERTTSMSFKLVNVTHRSPLMKTSATSSLKIVLSLTAFSMLSPVSFLICSSS